jgi:hypothetical protein
MRAMEALGGGRWSPETGLGIAQSASATTSQALQTAVAAHVRTQAWRTDAWTEGEELVLHMTPSDPAGELRPVRPAPGPGPLARAQFDTAGWLERLSVQDPRTAGAQVLRSASAADRAAALTPARFPAAQREALLRAAEARRWTALGGTPAVSEGTLVWRPADGDRERAVWQVRVTAQRDGVEAAFVVELDPMDGALLTLTREGVR